MEKINKYRKFLRIFQFAGMVALMGIGFVLIFTVGQKYPQISIAIITGLVAVMFAFMLFVYVPMQDKLSKMILEEAFNPIVKDLTFDKKKGYTEESFKKFNLVSKEATNYVCSDYYNFDYNGLKIETCMINYSNTVKVKRKKYIDPLFVGRLYAFPFETKDQFSVLGKQKPGVNRVKEMGEKGFNNIPLKFKKYFENFEVFYSEEKPEVNMQTFLEKVLSLKVQAKCPVSVILKGNAIVLAIENNKTEQERDLKKEIDITEVRSRRRDLQIVLNFVDSIKDLFTKDGE